MYALWPRSRGTCVPFQSGSAWKRQRRCFVRTMKLKTYRRCRIVCGKCFCFNYNIISAYFFLSSFFFPSPCTSTLIVFSSNRLSGYRRAQSDFIRVSLSTRFIVMISQGPCVCKVVRTGVNGERNSAAHS